MKQAFERKNSRTRTIEYMIKEARKTEPVHSVVDNTLSVNGVSVNRLSGKDFCTCSFDGLINVYDKNSTRLQGQLKGHEKGVWCVSYSPIDPILASGSNDSNVLLWDSKTYKVANTLSGHTDAVYDVKFSRSGKQIISCSKGVLSIWDLKNTKEPLKVIKDNENDFVYSVDFINNDKHIITGYMSGHLVVIDADDTSKITKLDLTPIRDVSLTAEKNNATYSIFKHVKPENDNSFYTTHTDGSVRAWDINTAGEFKCTKLFPYSFEPVTCGNISPNGEYFAVGGKDHSVVTFIPSAINVLDYSLRGHRDIVSGVEFLNDNTLITVSYDQSMKIWQLGDY